jgi:hypothetical protein
MAQDNISTLPLTADWPEEGVKSVSSPIYHKKPSQFLAELMMIHRDPVLQNKPFFWRDCQRSYMGFLVAIDKRLNGGVSFKILHNTIVKYKLTSLNSEADLLIANEILNEGNNGEIKRSC